MVARRALPTRPHLKNLPVEVGEVRMAVGMRLLASHLTTNGMPFVSATLLRSNVAETDKCQHRSSPVNRCSFDCIFVLEREAALRRHVSTVETERNTNRRGIC